MNAKTGILAAGRRLRCQLLPPNEFATYERSSKMDVACIWRYPRAPLRFLSVNFHFLGDKYPPAEPEALWVAGPSKGPDRDPKSKPLAPGRHLERCAHKTVGRPSRNCTHKQCDGALLELSNSGCLPGRAGELPMD